MGGYKHIESTVGEYIAGRYRSAIEVGIGRNTTAAETLQKAGVLKGCTDIKEIAAAERFPFIRDDIYDPTIRFYENVDLIYSIRPAIEMIPPLITLASRIDCDLIVYHLGFEIYGDGGESLDCGVRLHRYHRVSKAIEEG